MPAPLLSAAQRAALEHVRSTAVGQRTAALDRMARVLERVGLDRDVVQLLYDMDGRGDIVLNFHPDRSVREAFART